MQPSNKRGKKVGQEELASEGKTRRKRAIENNKREEDGVWQERRGEERRGEGGGTSELKSRRSERRQASRCEIQLNDKQTKRLAWLGLAWLGLALFVLLMQGGRQPSSLCFLSVVVVVWLWFPLVFFFFFFCLEGKESGRREG